MSYKKIQAILVVIFFSAIILAIGLPTLPVLSIYNRKNPFQAYYSRYALNDGFCISYTHSVNKGRVHDYYKCTEDKQLMVERTVFESYGAGIPEPEETPGAVFNVTENGYEISSINRKIPQLIMAVGIVANHSFATGNDINKAKEYFLTDFFEPQTGIILQINRISIVKYIFERNKFLDYKK